MTRGRKPKPTAQKKLQNNPGKRAINKKEPMAKRTAVIAPAHLDELSAAFLKRIQPGLDEMHVVADVDLPALELMALHYSLAWRAAEILKEQGLITVDAFGGKHKHPMLQVMKDNSSSYKAFAAEFGLTPSSRTRLQAPDLPDEDELEKAFFGNSMGISAKH
jgi:P27 family predicted phage terminase small subunit